MELIKITREQNIMGPGIRVQRVSSVWPMIQAQVPTWEWGWEKAWELSVSK